MARELARRSLPSGRIARVIMSEAIDGDASDGATIGGPEGSFAGCLVTASSATKLRQVHGADVVVVDAPGACKGSVADAAVTDVVGAHLVIQVADCVPVALLGDCSVGVVHAGWRGLRAGVLERTVEALTTVDGTVSVSAVVGPHIGPCCYEFGEDGLIDLAAQFGPSVRSKTIDGGSALNLSAVVASVLERAQVPVAFDGACTSCDDRYWSFRATGTPRRQAMVAWLEEG